MIEGRGHSGVINEKVVYLSVASSTLAEGNCVQAEVYQTLVELKHLGGHVQPAESEGRAMFLGCPFTFGSYYEISRKYCFIQLHPTC